MIIHLVLRDSCGGGALSARLCTQSVSAGMEHCSLIPFCCLPPNSLPLLLQPQPTGTAGSSLEAVAHLSPLSSHDSLLSQPLRCIQSPFQWPCALSVPYWCLIRSKTPFSLHSCPVSTLPASVSFDTRECYYLKLKTDSCFPSTFIPSMTRGQLRVCGTPLSVALQLGK